MAPPIKKPGKAVLPTKERGLFARLIQEYEAKKYKAGVKTADQILKKFPEHGETLCMKGLILASLDRKAEGLELAKQGLRYDLTSFISWHALGILQRIVKNYTESIKCYAQALKIEGGNNVNLVRESAYMYIQLRQWPKVVENRATLVRMQPHLRMNWAGLAVALHLGGNAKEAVRVLEKFENIHRDVPTRSFEQSEVYLYHAQILLEDGRHQDAIDYLALKTCDQVVDVKASKLIQGKCQLALGKLAEAQSTFEELLTRNDEDRQYISLWLTCNGVTAAEAEKADESRALTAFEQLRTAYPSSRAVQRMALAYITGDAFQQQAKAYIVASLQKGIPSLFNDVRALYADEAKRSAIEAIVEDVRQEWSKAPLEGPTSLLWALYFLAQHYNHLGQHLLALQYINSAIAHSPTLPELHMTRARVFKKAGAVQWASVAMEEARSLDGQDRSLNGKAAKYLLRAGDVAGASAKAGLFTKPDVADPVADLLEMQATWYLIEEARAWLAKGNYAMALKRCTQINGIYTEIWDDQLDFHSYCVRKFTLRAYVDMVRIEDKLHAHHAYFRAATTAIGILLTLHDQPELYTGAAPASNGNLTEEQKKEAKKARKQEARAAAEEAAKKTSAAKAKPAVEDDEAASGPPKDDDPEGKAALKAVQPLEDAEQYLAVLQRHAASRVETWLLTYEVAQRSQNWLLASKAVARAHALAPNHAGLHLAVVRLRRSLSGLDSEPAAVRDSIKATLKSIVPLSDEEGTLEAYRTEFVQRHGSDGASVLAGVRSLLLLRGDTDAGGDATAALVDLAKQTHNGTVQSSLATLYEGLALLQKLRQDSNGDAITSYIEAAHGAYPLADGFKSKAQKEQEDVARENERLSWTYAPPEAGEASDGVGGKKKNGKA